MSIPGERVAHAYLEACLIELRALKPGNVHALAGGHSMTVADFETSARVSAPAISTPGPPVGRRIRDAIRRTREAVGCNTNLGIVLLCAPLGAAALAPGAGSIRERLRAVLATLDVTDSEDAFAAIRMAQPAGLGDSVEHDVRRPATVDLRAAMEAARERDRVARQYASGFHDVFELGVPRLEAGLAQWSNLHWAATATYLGFLSAFPDSHIVRKFGTERAEAVRSAAGPLAAELLHSHSPDHMRPALLDFDARLKSLGINPGTSADLTVASLFAFRLEAETAAICHDRAAAP